MAEQNFTLEYTGKEINDKLSHISEIDKTIEVLQGKDTELSERITVINTAVTGYSADISGLDDQIKGNTAGITTLQASVGSHTQDIENLQAKDKQLERTIAQKVDIGTYKDKIGEIETNIKNQDINYNQFTQNIDTNYTARMNNNEANINTLNARVFGGNDTQGNPVQSIPDELDGKIAGLEEGYQNADNDLSAAIISNADKISDIEKRVSALEGVEYPDLTDELSNINDAITQLQETISALAERVTNLENNAAQPVGQ